MPKANAGSVPHLEGDKIGEKPQLFLSNPQLFLIFLQRHLVRPSTFLWTPIPSLDPILLNNHLFP
jgi:hypothetical protein